MCNAETSDTTVVSKHRNRRMEWLCIANVRAWAERRFSQRTRPGMRQGSPTGENMSWPEQENKEIKTVTAVPRGSGLRMATIQCFPLHDAHGVIRPPAPHTSIWIYTLFGMLSQTCISQLSAVIYNCFWRFNKLHKIHTLLPWNYNKTFI
jgi:hypothetical protein